jgi:hypothetical protein
MSTTSATLLSAHNRILLAGLDPVPFTPTEQLLLAALVGGLPVPRGHPIRAGWGIEREQQAIEAAARAEPHIAAHHSCFDGGPCAACAEYDAALIEIERRERDGERCR